MSKLELTMKWCRQHSFCIIVMLIVVLISVIVVSRGHDKDLVSHVSLACAIAGGLLAIIVIVYTLIDSADVRANLTEMRMLISDIRRETVQTASSMEQMKSDVLERILGKEQETRKADTDMKQADLSPQKNAVPFKLSELRSFHLSCLYFCTKMFEFDRKVSAMDMGSLISDSKNQLPEHMAFLIFGLLSTCEGLFTRRQFYNRQGYQLRILQMPTVFASLVNKELKVRIEEPHLRGNDEIDQAYVRSRKQAIDDYFSTS